MEKPKKDEKPAQKRDRSKTPSSMNRKGSTSPNIRVSNLDSAAPAGKFKGALALKIKPLTGKTSMPLGSYSS